MQDIKLERHKIRKEENVFLKQIRDNEIKDPAPFGRNKLLLLDDPRTLIDCPKTALHNRSTKAVLEDVPIEKIVGINNSTHLDNYTYGMSLREILFRSLHGASLTQNSLDYFLGDDIKGDAFWNVQGFTEMPQDKTCEGNERARGGINLAKRADVYFVMRGQQRVLMAMFWIYQMHGLSGVLKKVSVY